MMNETLIVGTRQGIGVWTRRAGAWHLAARGLEGRHVTGVIAREGVILAGTTDGVYRSDDGGGTWAPASGGLDLRHVRWMAYHPDISDCEFAGTEPAGLFVSHDGGGTWRACPEVAALRDRHGWSLPYSPQAGCVRGFAFSGRRGYAAVEVGGVLRSEDAGDHWALAPGSTGDPGGEGGEPFVHPDVHSVLVHPSSPGLVFAATGGGFYRSEDGGATWHLLYECYCRAAWADPSDAAHLVLGRADGVEEHGRIEESRDAGRTWRALDGPWRRDMVERFVPAGDTLLAVLAGGVLMAAPLATLAWETLLPDMKGVTAVAA